MCVAKNIKGTNSAAVSTIPMQVKSSEMLASVRSNNNDIEVAPRTLKSV